MYVAAAANQFRHEQRVDALIRADVQNPHAGAYMALQKSLLLAAAQAVMMQVQVEQPVEAGRGDGAAPDIHRAPPNGQQIEFVQRLGDGHRFSFSTKNKIQPSLTDCSVSF